MRIPSGLVALFASSLAFTAAISAHAGPLGGTLPDVTDRVTQPVNRLPDTTADLVDKTDLKSPAGPPLAQLKDPSALPSPLAIIGADGQMAFREVTLPDGSRAVAREWLVLASAETLSALKATPLTAIAEHDLAALEMTVVRLRLDSDLEDTRAALEKWLPKPLLEQLDRNHIYQPQAQNGESAAASPPTILPLCKQPAPLGMVDTAIATDHPAFAGTTIHQRDFFAPSADRQEGYTPPQAHGTAVASVLLRPQRLPEAMLHNASVFYNRNELSQGATSLHLVEGLNWLAQQGVKVINMSLAGPDNRLLQHALKKLHSQGLIVVSASGNEGPQAPPLFPAAYPFTIAVSATDERKLAYRWASGGEHVQFSAPGVSVTVARSDGQLEHQSGTSIASPVLSGIIACELARQDRPPEELVAWLANIADDLGKPGRDPVFGWGWLADERYRQQVD